MKPQKGFDWFKVVTTLMFIIGIGLSLLSVFFYVRLHWPDAFNFEKREESRKTGEMPLHPTGPSNFRVPASELLNHQVSEKEEELPALINALEEERPSNLDLEADRTVGITESDDEHNEATESRDTSGTDTNPEEAEAVLTQIHEAASRFRQILVRKREFALGVKLYREAIYDPKSITREYFEAKAAFWPLFGAYMRATGSDFDAFNPGGTIHEALSGLADMSADPEDRHIYTYFYTKLPE